MTTPDPYLPVEETEPVQLIEVDEEGDQPPAGWDPYAHDEDDRGDGVVVEGVPA